MPRETETTRRERLIAELDGSRTKVWTGVAETYIAEARAAQAAGKSGSIEARIAECSAALADLYKDCANV